MAGQLSHNDAHQGYRGRRTARSAAAAAAAVVLLASQLLATVHVASPATPGAAFSIDAIALAVDAATGREQGPRMYIYPRYDAPHPWANESISSCTTALPLGAAMNGNYLSEQYAIEQLRRLPNVVPDPAGAELFVIAHDSLCWHTALWWQVSRKRYRQGSIAPDPQQVAADAKVEAKLQAMGGNQYRYVFERYLKPLLLRVRATPQFAARGGADHVILMTMDHGICHWPNELQELLGRTIVLQPEGYSASRPALAVHAMWPRTCYHASHYVVVPPYFPERALRVQERSRVALIAQRTVLAAFRGTVMHTHPQHSMGVRHLLLLAYRMLPEGSPLRAQLVFTNVSFGDAAERNREFNNSAFCICPGGWASWTPRPFLCMAHGSVPVIIADGFVAPFEALLPWRNMTYKVLAGATLKVFEMLLHDRRVDVQGLQARQDMALAMMPYLLWTGEPRRSAAAALVLELACRFVWPRRPGGAPQPGVYCGHGEPPIGLDGWTSSVLQYR